MRKENKWLILYFALLIIPEIIFSPIINIFLSIFLPLNYLWRDNILFDSSVGSIYLNIVLILQLIGAILISRYFFKKQLKKSLPIILGSLFVLISLLIFLSIFFVNIFSSIGF